MASITVDVPWEWRDTQYSVRVEVGSYHRGTNWEPGGQDVEVLAVLGEDEEPDREALAALLADRTAERRVLDLAVGAAAEDEAAAAEDRWDRDCRWEAP